MVDHDALDELGAELHFLRHTHRLQPGRQCPADRIDILSESIQRDAIVGFFLEALKPMLKFAGSLIEALAARDQFVQLDRSLLVGDQEC